VIPVFLKNLKSPDARSLQANFQVSVMEAKIRVRPITMDRGVSCHKKPSKGRICFCCAIYSLPCVAAKPHGDI
jgi:hypothetical protein